MAADYEIIDIELGYDLFRAQLITASVKEAGFDVQLREMTTEGVAVSNTAPHILLVHAADLAPVRDLVHQSFPLD